MRIKKHITAAIYWGITRSSFAWIFGKCFRKKIFDGKGWLDLPSSPEFGTASAIFFRLYERPERLLISRYLNRNLDCIELGASIGVISRVVCSKLSKGRQFLQVEASPELSVIAYKNAARLHPPCQLAAINAAISYTRDDVVRFHRPRDSLSGRVNKFGDGVDVPTTTLQKVIGQFEIGAYSLVMDIEGMEYDLIKYEGDVLRNCRIMIVELHQGRQNQKWFVSEAEKLGFSCECHLHNVYVFLRASFTPQ